MMSYSVSVESHFCERAFSRYRTNKITRPDTGSFQITQAVFKMRESVRLKGLGRTALAVDIPLVVLGEEGRLVVFMALNMDLGLQFGQFNEQCLRGESLQHASSSRGSRTWAMNLVSHGRDIEKVLNTYVALVGERPT